MNEKLKPPVILLIVSTLLFFSLAGAGFYLFQKERSKSSGLQEELGVLQEKQRLAEKKLEESKKSIGDLDLKLQDARGQIDKLNTQLQQEKASKNEALAKIEQLRVDLEQQKGLRSDLEKRLSSTQKDTQSLQQQLKDLSTQKVDLEKKLSYLEKPVEEAAGQDVELGTVVVSPQDAPVLKTTPAAAKPGATAKQPVKQKAEKKAIEGKILVVNKDYDFAVINLGSKDGIGTGDAFSAYHSNKYIGDLKVEKLHDSMAAAGFGSAEVKNKISEGDKVVRKSK